MQELSVEDIANRIIDAILELRTFDRKSLYESILPQLKIWTRKQSYKRNKIPSIDKLRIAAYKEKEEQLYWRSILKSLLTEDEMKHHYSVLRKHLEEMGLPN